MKRRKVTALIFVTFWLVVPLPGRPQDKSADRIQKQASDNQGQPKPLASPVVQPNPPAKDQNPSADVARHYVDHSVRVGTPVTVNSVKDRWDKALVIFTGLIVGVGIFQIIFLWKTVTATSANARAAE